MKTSQIPEVAEDEVIEHAIVTVETEGTAKKLRRAAPSLFAGPQGEQGDPGEGAWTAVNRLDTDVTVAGGVAIGAVTELEHTLEAGESYQVEAVLLYNGDTADGMLFSFSFPEVEATQVIGSVTGWNGSQVVTTTAFGGTESFPSGTGTAGAFAGAPNIPMVVRFVITNAAAGSLNFNIAAVSADPDAEITLATGSTVRIAKL